MRKLQLAHNKNYEIFIPWITFHFPYQTTLAHNFYVIFFLTIVRKFCWHKMPTVQIAKAIPKQKKDIQTHRSNARNTHGFCTKNEEKKSTGKIKEIFQNIAVEKQHRTNGWKLKLVNGAKEGKSKRKDLNVCAIFALTLSSVCITYWHLHIV